MRISTRIFGRSPTYKGEALFSKRPSDTQSLVTIDRFGPVGMSLELIQPAFTMRVGKIEEGSPAEATGQLKQGQIIESINGETLRDIDPRIQLATWITDAEANDGKLRLAIRGEAEPVVIQLPVLGAYRESWPLNCPKSDKIVRNMADYLKQPDANRGISDIGMIFLLSTGNEEDLEYVGEWARKMNPHSYAWFLGFAGIPLCEYYLRTGDEAVMANIQEAVDKAVAGQYLDGWAGRGGVPRVTYGYGHLNAAGTGVVTFLMLAKECGTNVPDHALLGALRRIHDNSVSDDMIRRYVHHQDAVVRLTAAAKVLGVNRGYIGWREPGGKARPEPAMELLKSDSPRVRPTMFKALAETFREEQQMDLLTLEVFELAIQSIKDPKESWWVKDAAMHVVSYGMPDQAAPHVDLLLSYLDVDAWWLQNAAMTALIPVVADERCYEKVLPRIGELIRTNQRAALTLGLMKPMPDKIKLADPKVHELAVETLRESYTQYAGYANAPGGLDVSCAITTSIRPNPRSAFLRDGSACIWRSRSCRRWATTWFTSRPRSCDEDFGLDAGPLRR